MKRGSLGRIRRIHDLDSYTVGEFAKLQEVHPGSVLTWIKEGMPVIDHNSKPYLIWGADAKAFLLARKNEKKKRLAQGEFLCQKCRSAVRSAPENISFRMLGMRSDGRPSKFMANGKCLQCGVAVNRFYGLEFVKGPEFELLYKLSDKGL